jgi:hypothetical protein
VGLVDFLHGDELDNGPGHPCPVAEKEEQRENHDGRLNDEDQGVFQKGRPEARNVGAEFFNGVEHEVFGVRARLVHEVLPADPQFFERRGESVLNGVVGVGAHGLDLFLGPGVKGGGLFPEKQEEKHHRHHHHEEQGAHAHRRGQVGPVAEPTEETNVQRVKHHGQDDGHQDGVEKRRHDFKQLIKEETEGREKEDAEEKGAAVGTPVGELRGVQDGSVHLPWRRISATRRSSASAVAMPFSTHSLPTYKLILSTPPPT